jgi:hypothetical protein
MVMLAVREESEEILEKWHPLGDAERKLTA